MTAILDTHIHIDEALRRARTDLVQCHGCPDQRPRKEIREYAGYPLCRDCYGTTAQADDRDLTRELAYAY